MKKIFNILLMLLVAMVLVACGSSTEKEAKTYDEDFIKSLAKGLDNRWSYSVKIKNSGSPVSMYN
jgi:outer membrane biogenesis lipoprotein LolB